MRARLAVARLPRDLHPVAWWLWAVGLAVAASFTTNPWLLLLLIGVACLAVAARRSAQPWADSFRLYLWRARQVKMRRAIARSRKPRMAAEGDRLVLLVAAVRIAAFGRIEFGQ